TVNRRLCQMSATLHETDLEERLATLERRFEQLVGPLYPPDVDDAPAPHVGYAEPAASPIAPGRRVWRPSPAPSPVTFEPWRLARVRTPTPRQPSQPLSDVVGGRLLAWLGGIATLIGIVLFLALAVSHGWIGEQARVCLAAA